MKEQAISVSEFKARCLRLIDELHTNGGSLLITKRGRPMVKVTAVQPNRASRMGDWAGTVTIKGDIVHFDTSEDWESLK